MDHQAPSSDQTPGIPPALLARLRRVLAACPAFATDAALAALFVDERLRAWKERLPQVDTIQTRALRVIEALHEETNTAGVSALALLLQVLADLTDPGDRQRYYLAGLARELARETVLLSPDRAPYLGLSTFQEADAGFFFGRETLVAQLLDKARTQSFLAVLGPSGSGKSSVVRAGLLPALKRGELPGSDGWQCLLLKPGPRPLDTLASELLYHFPHAPLPDGLTLIQLLASDENALIRVAALLRARLVLVVDQFEEVWTQATAEAAQGQALIRLLLTAAAPPDKPLLVILTLRADFLHRAATHPELSHWIAEHDVIVSPMQPEELRQAIEGPAQLAGGYFAAGLVEKLVEEVAGEPGALPLLEYTLLELWQARQNNEMSWDTYHLLGGVEGALAARADELLNKHYTEKTREELRHILLRLIQPGEGMADTRRRALLEDLTPSGGSLEAVQALLGPLTDERLLVTGRDASTRAETVEVAHEALIRAWPTLHAWIEEARADLVQHLHLEQGAKEWEQNDQDPTFLWAGLRLANAEAWVARARPWLSERDGRFLQASREQEAARAATEEAAQQERERLLTERAEAEEKARQAAEARAAADRHNLRVLLTILIPALILAGYAWYIQQREAQARRTADQATLRAEQALSRQLTLSAEDWLEGGYHEIGLLLAIEAGRVADTNEALVTLHKALTAPGRTRLLLEHNDPVSGATWSADGSRILTASGDTARVWDTRSGEQLLLLRHHGARISQALWSADESRIMTFGGDDEDGRVWVWDAHSGEPLLSLLHAEMGQVSQAAWSVDQSRILTASGDTARVWDARSGEQLLLLRHHGLWVSQAAWNADESRILTVASGSAALVWDAASGEQLFSLGEELVHQATWDSGGRRILTAGSDGVQVWDARSGERFLSLAEGASQAIWNKDESRILTIRAVDIGIVQVWDASSGQQLLSFFEEGNISQASWNADESHILITSFDAVSVWDASSGQQLLVLGHRGWVNQASWNADERRILTASDDGSVRVWDTEADQELLTLPYQRGDAPVSWSADKSRILTVGSDGAAHIWDAHSSQEILSLDGDVIQATWSRDASRILTAGFGGARIWDAHSGELLLVLPHEGASWVNQAIWNTDESLILTISVNLGPSPAVVGSTIHIWDARSGKQRFMLPHRWGAIRATWNADGDRFLTTGDYNNEFWEPPDNMEAQVWDATSGEQLLSLSQEGELITQAVWSPDETHLLTANVVTATNSDEGVGLVRILDARSGERLLALPHEGASFIGQIVWNADGSRILTASDDNTSRVWDAHSGEQLLALPHEGTVSLATWNADESRILTASDDGMVHVWDAHTGQPLLSLPDLRLTEQIAWGAAEGQIIVADSESIKTFYLQMEDLLALACEQVLRQMTPEEWQEWMGTDEPYHPTCPTYSRYVGQGERLARTGDLAGAVAAFTEALQVEPALNLDPISEAQQYAIPALIGQGRVLAKQGDIDGAVARFTQALKLDPSFLTINPQRMAENLAAQTLLDKSEALAEEGSIQEALSAHRRARDLAPHLIIPSEHWFSLCFWGSVWNDAEAIIEVCNEGISTTTGNDLYGLLIRRSRGVARALIGEYDGAIEDFEFYLEAVGDVGDAETIHQAIKELKAGHNPFNEEKLKEMRGE